MHNTGSGSGTLTNTNTMVRFSVPDPGSGAFFIPGFGIRDSGWVKSGSGIRDEQPGSYFLELGNQFFGLKYLNSLMRIRDPGWKQFGSGIRDGKKSGIRDKHPGSATLVSCPVVLWERGGGERLPSLRCRIPGTVQLVPQY
jgi:hypothetical protein